MAERCCKCHRVLVELHDRDRLVVCLCGTRQQVSPHYTGWQLTLALASPANDVRP